MYNDTITLFNRFETKTECKWYSTIIENVDLNTDKAKILAKYGENSQDSAKLHIRYERKYDAIIVGGKQFLSPKEWLNEPNKEEYITLTSGQQFDFFIRGRYEQGVIDDSNYKNGFYDYINKVRDCVYAVTSVGGPYDLIPHFEVMGK